MSITIAITGKGGVGKSTLAGLSVRWLVENRYGPVLAVDADPNTCLDSILGVQVETTVGGVREEAKSLSGSLSSGGLGKQELLDLKIQQALVESDSFDLIAMGRPEGPGCYCYANNVLRAVLEKLTEDYPAVVIDNEAGLENLSRRTVSAVNWLLFVTDDSSRGLRTAHRLFRLAEEMGIGSEQQGLLVNRARSEDCLQRAREEFADTEVLTLGLLPEDNSLAELDSLGRPIFDLPEDSVLFRAFSRIMERNVGRHEEGSTLR